MSPAGEYTYIGRAQAGELWGPRCQDIASAREQGEKILRPASSRGHLWRDRGIPSPYPALRRIDMAFTRRNGKRNWAGTC